jgi:hypothetical protein
VLLPCKTCVEAPVCSPEYLTCRSGIYEMGLSQSGASGCIPLSWRCDGQTECSDASDEEDCSECRPDQFWCQTGQCIAKKHECDGIPQCMDRADEQRGCPLGSFTVQNFVSMFLVCLIAQMNPTNRLLPAQTV